MDYAFLQKKQPKTYDRLVELHKNAYFATTDEEHNAAIAESDEIYADLVEEYGASENDIDDLMSHFENLIEDPELLEGEER